MCKNREWWEIEDGLVLICCFLFIKRWREGVEVFPPLSKGVGSIGTFHGLQEGGGFHDQLREGRSWGPSVHLYVRPLMVKPFDLRP